MMGVYLLLRFPCTSSYNIQQAFRKTQVHSERNKGTFDFRIPACIYISLLFTPFFLLLSNLFRLLFCSRCLFKRRAWKNIFAAGALEWLWQGTGLLLSPCSALWCPFSDVLKDQLGFTSQLHISGPCAHFRKKSCHSRETCKRSHTWSRFQERFGAVHISLKAAYR